MSINYRIITEILILIFLFTDVKGVETKVSTTELQKEFHF